MIKFFLIIFYTYSLLILFPVQGAPKNKETYEHLDLFSQIFDRVRSSYVEEVTDISLIQIGIEYDDQYLEYNSIEEGELLNNFSEENFLCDQ